jgi:hypothetical protein
VGKAAREARVILFERAPPRIVEGCKRKASNETNFTTWGRPAEWSVRH